MSVVHRTNSDHSVKPTRKPKVSIQREDIIKQVERWNSFEKIDHIKTGISKVQLEKVKQQTGLDYETLAHILSVTKATLHSKKGESKFSPTVSERILLLADVYAYGYDVFEDKQRFNIWMLQVNRSLGDKKPIDLLDTLYGVQEVKSAIGRIDYGIYA